MAWSHSYTPQAYDDARVVLETWNREDLCKALADYNYGKFHGDPPYRKGDPHRKGLWSWAKIHKDPHITHDILVSACMDAIYDVSLCNAGGSAMWIDYDGYHKVELPDCETCKHFATCPQNNFQVCEYYHP